MKNLHFLHISPPALNPQSTSLPHPEVLPVLAGKNTPSDVFQTGFLVKRGQKNNTNPKEPWAVRVKVSHVPVFFLHSQDADGKRMGKVALKKLASPRWESPPYQSVPHWN